MPANLSVGGAVEVFNLLKIPVEEAAEMRRPQWCYESGLIKLKRAKDRFLTPPTQKNLLNTSVHFLSHFSLQRAVACSGHGTPLRDHVRHQQPERRDDTEIIGTKSLPACHGMQSVLYIRMYWTQTCHRLRQPHSSRAKPILSAAQCALSTPHPHF